MQNYHTQDQNPNAGGGPFDPSRWFLPDDPTLGFVHIPAGPFWMGSDDLSDDERPLHQVDLPEFWIARYPITVAQYRIFTQHSACIGFDPAALDGLDNHPVVWVTWVDALAYTAWLHEGLVAYAKDHKQGNALWQGLYDGHLQVTLPSEAEWEKAARGTDGRRYSWGEVFDPQKLNIDETGIGSTSPVGCFPAGASPYGVLDMAGNTWEWTRSIAGDWDDAGERFVSRYLYPYIPGDGREDLGKPANYLRVIRGSSFAHDRTDTPCAYRGWDHIDFKSSAYGFRVVVSNDVTSDR